MITNCRSAPVTALDPSLVTMAAWDSRSPAISQKETKRTKVRGVGFAFLPAAFLGACVMTEVRAQVIIVPNSLATNDGNAFNTTPSGPGSVVTGNQTLGELVNVTSNTGVSVAPKPARWPLQEAGSPIPPPSPITAPTSR